MTNTPPEPHRASDTVTLKKPSTPDPLHSNSATKSPHSNTLGPKQTFNPDGTRKYLNIRPAGGQPFPLEKGKKYLAEDYRNIVEVKKGEGAISSAKKRKAHSNRAAGSDSATQDNKCVREQKIVPLSHQHSSLDSDSSPERPLIEVLRSIRRDGEKVEGSASGEIGRSGDAGKESDDDRGRKVVRNVGRRGGTRSVEMIEATK